MKKIKSMAMILLTMLLLICLVGCSERYKENRRIINKAERVAEKQAISYIKKKYGFTATPLGYDIQGGGTLAWNAHPEVVVKLSYEDQIFYASVNIDKKGETSDNYEKEIFSKVFADYLIDIHNLPMPTQMDISFYLLGTSDYFFPVGNDGVGAENVTGMVNFKYNNQSVDALLKEVASITYALQYTASGNSLDEIVLKTADWPAHQGFSIDLNICRYNDEESYFSYLQCPTTLWGDNPHPDVYRYLSEWYRSYIQYDRFGDNKEPELKKEYFAFHSLEIEGFTFVTDLPDPLDELVQVSKEQKVWKYETTTSNEIHGTEYEQISPIFTVPRVETHEGNVVMVIPEEYIQAQGEVLYLAEYDSEKDDFFTKWIPLTMSETDSNAYIQITSRSQNLFFGKQYALLKCVGQYKRPILPHPDVTQEEANTLNQE